jgi:hypothetical protein
MGWRTFYPRLGPVTTHHWERQAFCIVDRDANLIWLIEKVNRPLT